MNYHNYKGEGLMSNNRFKTLTRLNIDYYEENTPVEIDKGAILLDTVSNQVLLQLKFRNISQYNVNFVEIEVECFDSTGDKVSENNVVTYAYQDFVANSQGLFGDRQAIKLPSLNTRKVNINLKRVMFENGEVITFDEIKKIPNPFLTRVETLPSDLRVVIDPTIEYLPQELGNNKWACCCGRVNIGDVPCIRCGRDKEKQFKELDMAHLEQLAIQYKEKEIRLREQREKQNRERQEKVRKLIPIIGGGIAAMLVLGLAIDLYNNRKDYQYNAQVAQTKKDKEEEVAIWKEMGPEQFRIVQSEENLKDIYLNNSEHMVKSTVRIHAENVVSCKGECESNYMTYEEAEDLLSRYEIEKKNGTYSDTQLFNNWWKENKERFKD